MVSDVARREASRIRAGFLTFSLSGPIAVSHVVLVASARGSFDDRTAIEGGVLLASGYAGFLSVRFFLSGVVALFELMVPELKEVRPKPDEKIPTGFVFSLVILLGAGTYFSASGLMLFIQPDYYATSIGWAVLGGLFFAAWLAYVIWPNDPGALQKFEGERRVMSDPRRIPERLLEPVYVNRWPPANMSRG